MVPYRIFISAVSDELGHCRREVARVLRRKGLEVREQEHFSQGPATLIERLSDYIQQCEAVVLLVGEQCGAFPSDTHAAALGNIPIFDQYRAATGQSRASYTQWEFMLAKYHRRKTYVFLTDTGFRPDESDTEAADLHACQQAYRAWIKNIGEHRDALTFAAKLIEDVLVLPLSEAQTVESVQTQIAERFLDQLLANKEISAEEARRRALAELPEVVGLPAAAIQQLIDKKIAPRMQDAALSPLERAKAALSAGDYDAVFAETGKQRTESRELAILEGTAALARFRGDPQPAWNEKVLAAFRRALALSDAGAQPLEWAQVAVWVAFVLTDIAQYREAEPLLRQAMKLREEMLGQDDPAVAEALNNLALLLQATNRLKEAEPLMRRALEIDEKRYGPEHPKVAIRLNNLALLLQTTNRLQEAEPLMRRAVKLREEKVGADDPAVAVALNNLALLLQATNRLQEAEPLMRRTLAIDEQSYGPEHPSVARDLNNLALLLQETNRLQEAESLMRRALEIDEQSYGPEHPAVARDLNNLAQLLKATNRLQEAEPLMRRALAIDEQSYGPEHPSVARDLNNLALLLQDTNRLQEAERLMRRALGIDEQSYGPEHPDVAIDLNNLAVLLQHTNRLEAAESFMRRALEIDEQSYGPEHPDVAIDLNNLAVLLQGTDRLQEAEPLLRRALAIDEQSYGPEHPDVARDLNNLAQLLKAADRPQEAEPLSRRMFAILLNFTCRTGHEHPKLQQATRSYAAILKGLGRSEAEIEVEIRALQEQYGVTVD